MRIFTFQNIKVRDLPSAWARHIGARPDDLVSVTIRPEKPQHSRKPIDRKAIRKLLEKVDSLPILDDRMPDEVLGYDEYGLPT